jgi:hypothetical protein
MVPSEPGVEFLSRGEVCHEHGADHVAELVEDGPSNQEVASFDERADALEVRRSNGLPASRSLGIGAVPGDDYELHARSSHSREPDSTVGDAPKQRPAQEDEDPRVLSCLGGRYCDWDR